MLNKEQIHHILQQIKAPIFDNLDEAEVIAIIQAGQIIECFPGDQIIGKDDVDQTIFILLTGSMEIRDGDLLIRQVEPGETIGELAFLLSAQRTIDIFAGPDGAQVLSLEETSLRNRLHASLHPEALLLLNLSKILAQKLAEVTRDLRKTQSRMVHQEKLASLGKLTTGIAHELKNPLNFINNFSGLNKNLLEELKELLLNQSLSNEDIISETIELAQVNSAQISFHGKRANTIVQNMLEHASQSKGKHVKVAVNSLVKNVVYKTKISLQSTHPNFQIRINSVYDETVGKLYLSPQYIERVLENILRNAIDAVHEKKQVIEGTYIPEISIHTKSVDEYVEVHIKDNGMGVPQDFQNKIFDPFYTTKSSAGNSGLGLSISYDIIVEGHNGSLTVESKAGKGAVFTVSLPKQ